MSLSPKPNKNQIWNLNPSLQLQFSLTVCFEIIMDTQEVAKNSTGIPSPSFPNLRLQFNVLPATH